MIKRARSKELGNLELFDGISGMSSGYSVLSDIIYFDKLTKRAGSVVYKHYLLGKRTQNATPSLQTTFENAPIRRGKRVYERPIRVGQEMSSSAGDVHSPDQNHPYRSKI